MHGPTTEVYSCNPSVARVHDIQADRFGGPLPGETNVHCRQYEDDDWYIEYATFANILHHVKAARLHLGAQNLVSSH